MEKIFLRIIKRGISERGNTSSKEDAHVLFLSDSILAILWKYSEK